MEITRLYTSPGPGRFFVDAIKGHRVVSIYCWIKVRPLQERQCAFMIGEDEWEQWKDKLDRMFRDLKK